MDTQKFIAKYDSSQISEIDYVEILNDLRQLVVGIPFPIVSPHKGDIIERVRINYDGEIFKYETEVSLRTDLDNISEFGRLNKPEQANFYGTFVDDDITKARITTINETHRTLRKRNTKTVESQIFTTSQWQVKDDLRLLVLPFHSEVRNNSRMLHTAVYFRLSIEKSFGSSAQGIQNVLNFFSDQFSKEVQDHLDYKLTAAFGEVFMEDYEIDGIVYPSLKADFETQNVALSPKAMSKIRLFKVGMFELFINEDHVVIDPMAYAEDLGPSNSDFNWIAVKRTSPEDIDEKLRGISVD